MRTGTALGSSRRYFLARAVLVWFDAACIELGRLQRNVGGISRPSRNTSAIAQFGLSNSTREDLAEKSGPPPFTVKSLRQRTSLLDLLKHFRYAHYYLSKQDEYNLLSRILLFRKRDSNPSVYP